MGGGEKASEEKQKLDIALCSLFVSAQSSANHWFLFPPTI